jgi:FMN reductase
MSGVVAVVGNPRPHSRTYAAALELRDAIADGAETGLVDLAEIGGELLDRDSAARARALETAAGADVLVVASPTYKATYTGLLKLFFDAYGPAPLSGVRAVPLMLGAAPVHSLAVDVHLTPLLLELGASVPHRGLFVLETELPGFSARARDYAAAVGS